MLELSAENLSMRFGSRSVFRDIAFDLKVGQALAVFGPNGSGKTTLLHLIAGLARPTGGEVGFREDGRKLDFDDFRRRMALVAPYLALYESLTALENLKFLATVTGRVAADDELLQYLDIVGLADRGGDTVGVYSSGMKQRLRYAAALLKEPEVFLIDEPGVNLDEAGRTLVYRLIREKASSAIVVVATNEREECSLAGEICQLAG